MGLETHCFAWESGAVCKDVADAFYPISIRDKESILEICPRIRINGILTIASDLAVETVNYVADKMHLTANPYPYTNLVTNKIAMRDKLKSSNASSPFYYSLNQQNTDFDKVTFPVVVKPADRSGSLGVEKVSDVISLKNAIQKAQEASFAKEVIVEQYIEGREVSVEAISWHGQHYILAITDKVTTDNYFVEIAHHKPSMLNAKIVNAIKTLTRKALDVLHVENGASHTEIKITPQGSLYIIEVGARMGGDFIGSHLVELSTGYDFLQGVIDVALGKFSVPKIAQKHFSGVYFLSQETSSLKNILAKSNEYPFIVKSEIFDNELKTLHASSDRSGYLIYKSDKRINLL